ncbi:hypothetical protein HOC35_03325 [Candidatus Woesearchaeota archaeon]|jgi:hypothetical protein|nr:hypothetical protein [Candidatus Woesearchaeota archaeon]
MDFKALLRKWWFWLIVIYFIIGLYIGMFGGFYTPEPNLAIKIILVFIWPIIFF